MESWRKGSGYGNKTSSFIASEPFRHLRDSVMPLYIWFYNLWDSKVLIANKPSTVSTLKYVFDEIFTESNNRTLHFLLHCHFNKIFINHFVGWVILHVIKIKKFQEIKYIRDHLASEGKNKFWKNTNFSIWSANWKFY